MRLAIRGSRDDFHNREVSAFLACARWQYFIEPGPSTESGRRTAYIYLPHVWAALELMNACPQLELAFEKYRGAER
ncbi:hypothetical protein [uncultured Jannaschia sp.]|uniref:hypothetical protein n=1 Tax=uncultured Jannaschia sp. TaxID=293347 RepID=UPI002606B221|nr:hypothetical protein [uncultured Jannaschia sp.]